MPTMPARNVRVRLSSRNCLRMSRRRAPSALSRPISRGALGDGDEHDVHDADAADAEGHGADDSEEELERGAELHDLGGVGHGVPAGNGLVVFGVEVVTVGEDGAHGLERLEMQFG